LRQIGGAMKQYLLLILLFCGIFSCRSKDSWTEKDRKEFLGGCLKGAAKDMGQEKAADYCRCMWEKIQQRYPTPVSPSFIQNDTALQRLGRECFAAQ
jgi:hypothetical protein